MRSFFHTCASALKPLCLASFGADFAAKFSVRQYAREVWQGPYARGVWRRQYARGVWWGLGWGCCYLAIKSGLLAYMATYPCLIPDFDHKLPGSVAVSVPGLTLRVGFGRGLHGIWPG